jgi:hypothetical protein
MALQRRRFRRRGSATAWAIAGVSSLGAGASVLYLLDPARRERARHAVRDAQGRAAAGASRLGERAARVLHDASEWADARRRSERARSVAGPGPAREALGATAAGRPSRGAAGTSAVALVVLAMLGRGLLRIPLGLLGAWMLLKLAAASAPARRGMRRATLMARDTADRLRRAGAAGAAGGEAGALEAEPPGQAREAHLQPPGSTARARLSSGQAGAPAIGEPLIAAPDAAFPEVDAAPRILGADERPASPEEVEDEAARRVAREEESHASPRIAAAREDERRPATEERREPTEDGG